MNKIKITISFTLLFFVNLHGQDLIEIKNKKSNEKYFVLKSNQNIKHGKYEKFHAKNKVEVSGHYSDNQKDSLWSYYAWDGNITEKGTYKNDLKNGSWEYSYSGIKKSSGNYENDTKIGVWDYYNQWGVLIQKYDHSSGALIFRIKDEASKIALTNDSIGDYEPLILGGIASFQYYLFENMQYPQKAVENNVSANVAVNFKITSNGELFDFQIENNPGFNLDEEAIRLIKNFQLFIPKKENGIQVDGELTITIKFILN